MLLVLVILVFSPLLGFACDVSLPTLSLQSFQYNGSWFVIALREPSSSFLPANVTSSLIKLQVMQDNQLNITEYHTWNNVCMPPLHGTWTKADDGYKMSTRTENGQLYSILLRAVYHEYSGEQNEEMNMVLYGCAQYHKSGKCKSGEELLLIMSNSRHPQTLQLFKSAKLIEDAACIDILEFRILQTYSSCGDDVVDEDQKLIHAIIDENNEFVDVECKVANFKPTITNFSSFFDEPRVLTVIAYMDPLLSKEQIAHVSCVYDKHNHATCEWIRQQKCFKTELHQSVVGGQVELNTTFTSLNGTTLPFILSGDVIWENGDEYISMKCILVDDDGGCDQYRIYVWSDEDHMDQPTINEIYRQLQSVCVDPTDLIFLNTFHECIDQPETDTSVTCGVPPVWTPISTTLLQGVWYFAADLNIGPKIFLQSAVISLIPNENKTNELTLRYFAKKESDSECVGPGEGTVILNETNGILEAEISYTYTLVPKYRNTLKSKYEVLYADNQRAVLYWCFKRNSTGQCTQHDVNIMIRSRHFSVNDLTMILPYLDKVCIKEDDLRWFDLHSQCSTEMASSSPLRRDLVSLSHYDVLHILTHVQEPRCKYNEVKGVKADLLALEKGGVWYLMSRYDEMAMDTYAMAGRIFAVENDSAVLRLRRSAALPNMPLKCYSLVFTVKEDHIGDDYFYELLYESNTQNTSTMIFRFLFFNRHVGVLYSCLANKADGTCDEKAIYVISRHETIDHAELIVLDRTSNAVCVETNVLYHTANHDKLKGTSVYDCLYDLSALKPAACSSVEESNANADWKTLDNKEIMSSYGTIGYHVVASSRIHLKPFILKFNGKQFERITESDSLCSSSPVKVQFSSRNRLLCLVDDEILLLHPAASTSHVLLKEAQLTGYLPCLHPLEPMNATCALLVKPNCKATEPLQVAEELSGDWILYASDPSYVLNEKCTVTQSGSAHLFSCTTESWIGECERTSELEMTIDAWGGFKFASFGENAPLRIPSELFLNGNITVTPTRMIMIKDGDLVGRRYSIWIRTGTKFTKELEKEAADYCIWPLEPQIRTMELVC